MSKITIIEGNSNNKDNVRAIMVKGEKGDKGDNGEITYSDVVDNLTSTSTQYPLSANQGKVLKDLVDANTIDILNNARNEAEQRQSADETLQNNINDEVSARTSADETLQSQISGLASGSPLVASSVSGMTDTTKVYVNTTDGYWYYYNGSAWVQGGVYQSTAIADNSVSLKELDNDLQTQLKDFKTIYRSGITLTGTHYRITDGKAVANTSTSSYNAIVLDVLVGELYYIRARESSNLTYGYIFVDDDMNVIEYGMRGTGSGTTFEEIVKVPAGATKLLNSFYVHIDNTLAKINVKNINDMNTKINKALKYEILNPTKKSNSHYRIADGKAVENTTVTGYYSVNLDVVSGEIYYIENTQSSGLTRQYILTDSELNVIDYGGYKLTQENVDTKITSCIIIPNGVTKMFISGHGTALTLKRAIDDVQIAEENPLANKTIAVIGDSISTKVDKNAYELIVEEEDVGVQLSAYLTYYDVNAGLNLGGHIFTSEEIGTEVTFTPTAEDVGKGIGKSANYNNANITTWWELMEQEKNCNVIPVCWSGSSITSHEAGTENKRTSYAHHPAQIRKVGIRTPGTMTRTSPDMIIIYRGTNDFSHNPYARLSDNTFDDYNYIVPETDKIDNDTHYGFKEGLVILISKLRETYPKAEIYVCTLNVFKRISVSHFPTNNGINSLPQYNNAIREVCDFMGCGCLELDKDGITFENCYSEGYITDSATQPTHPSSKGHQMIYKQIIKDLM